MISMAEEASPLPLTPKLEIVSSARKQIRVNPRSSEVPVIEDLFINLLQVQVYDSCSYGDFMPKLCTLLSALRMTRGDSRALQRASRHEAMEIVDTALQIRGETPSKAGKVLSSKYRPSSELDYFTWQVEFVDSAAVYRTISAFERWRTEAQLLVLQKLRLEIQRLTKVPFRMGIEIYRDPNFEVRVDTAKGEGQRLRYTIRKNVRKLNAALAPLSLRPEIEFSGPGSGYSAYAEVYESKLEKLNRVLQQPSTTSTASMADGMADFRDIVREINLQELFQMELQGAYHEYLYLAWNEARDAAREADLAVRVVVEGEYDEVFKRSKLVSVPSRIDPKRVDLSMLHYVFRGAIGEDRAEYGALGKDRSHQTTQAVSLMSSRRQNVRKSYWLFQDAKDRFAITYDGNFFGNDPEKIQQGQLKSLCRWADCADFKAIPLTIEWYDTPDSDKIEAHSLIMYLQRTGKVFLYDRNGYEYDAQALSTLVRRVLSIMDHVLKRDYYTRLYVGGLHEEIPSFRWSRGSCAVCGRFLPASREERCRYCKHNCVPKGREIHGDSLFWRSVPAAEANGLSLYYTETVTGGKGGTCVWFSMRHITAMATGTRMDASQHGRKMLVQKKMPTWSEPLYGLFYLYEERLGTNRDQIVREVSKCMEWFWAEPRRLATVRALDFADAVRPGTSALQF